MNIPDNASSNFSIGTVVSSAGNAVALDPNSAPVWSVNNPTLGVITSDGLSAIFTPSGSLGTVLLTCSIPAINTQPAIVGQISLIIGASEATTISLIKTN